jgi:hypothetical protein
MLWSLQPRHRWRTILQHRYVLVVVEFDVPNIGSGKDFVTVLVDPPMVLAAFRVAVDEQTGSCPFADSCCNQAIAQATRKGYTRLRNL